ncbi:hypothetical protein, partial [Escherichia coli]|uniref:hypothetical protein n=1 Tax=Escherichia coli TaxID=562 RepID=UPI003005A50A
IRFSYDINRLISPGFLQRHIEGFHHKVKNNILVESFDVPLKKTGAYQSIAIRFSYDINRLISPGFLQRHIEGFHHKVKNNILVESFDVPLKK